jgi:hypothetical protein
MLNNKAGVVLPFKIKRLFADIETSPNIVFSWRTGYKINLSHENIIHERKIICIGYKWEGEKKVTVLRWDSEQNDEMMLRQFIKIAEEADEIVGQNLDSFDIPWVRTRCLILGLPHFPPVKTLDTLQWARKYYYFNSNKLDYLAKVLGFGGKLRTDYELWKNIVLHKCEKSLNYMTKYCAMDIIRLEQVYHKLKFCTPSKTHAGVLGGRDDWSCPRTGSTDVIKSKTVVTARGTVQHQMKNRVDGTYFTISNRAYESYLAAKKSK